MEAIQSSSGWTVAPIKKTQSAMPIIQQQVTPIDDARVDTFKTAIIANACTVSLLAHSIGASANQAPISSGVFRLLKNRIKQFFPGVTFTFNDLAIGGTTAAQPLSWTTPTNFTVPSTTKTNYEERWVGISQSAGKLWMQYVADTAPDLLILQFDLNETNVQTFRTSLLALINDVDTDARWTAKRPSLMVIISHTGTNTPSIIRGCHRVARGICAEKGIPYADAGRLYDILTTGYETLDFLCNFDAELFMRVASAGPSLGQVAIGGGAFTLDPTFWDVSNFGTSPTGSDLRSLDSNPMRVLRKRNCTDGAIQQQASSFNASNTFSLFYRVDPSDANYSAGTGQAYEVRLSGTTVKLYHRASGGATTELGSMTIANGVSSSSTHLIRAEYRGDRHYIECVDNGNVLTSLEVRDGRIIQDGYQGMGTTGGTTARWTVSTTNQKQSSVMEFGNPVQIGGVAFSDKDLVGFGGSNDFINTAGAIEGNGTNHPTGLGLAYLYEPAVSSCLEAIQAAVF